MGVPLNADVLFVVLVQKPVRASSWVGSIQSCCACIPHLYECATSQTLELQSA